MKCLKRNKQKIYISQYLGRVENIDEDGNYTGEFTPTYSSPAEWECNISASNGTIMQSAYGKSEKYSKVIVTDEMDLGIDDKTLFWVDAPITKSHDYEVTGISRSLNSVTIYLTKVDVR